MTYSCNISKNKKNLECQMNLNYSRNWLKFEMFSWTDQNVLLYSQKLNWNLILSIYKTLKFIKKVILTPFYNLKNLSLKNFSGTFIFFATVFQLAIYFQFRLKSWRRAFVRRMSQQKYMLVCVIGIHSLKKLLNRYLVKCSIIYLLEKNIFIRPYDGHRFRMLMNVYFVAICSCIQMPFFLLASDNCSLRT